jgi:hypothetical protein
MSIRSRPRESGDASILEDEGQELHPSLAGWTARVMTLIPPTRVN